MTQNDTSLKPLKILVAEDNEVNQKVIRFILDRIGLAYEIAVNGVDVLSRYSQNHFDLILMDCQMPEMDGLEATQKIREFELKNNVHRCAIVAMTANAMNGDRDRCLGAGMDDFISKPFKSQDVIQMIHSWASKINGQGG